MNWMDIGILAFLGIAALAGLYTGMVKMLFFVAGIAVGTVMAGNYSAALATHLPFIPRAELARVVAFLIIFLAVMIAAAVAAGALQKLLSFIMLGWANHLAGAILGLVVGAAICGVLLVLGARFGTTGIRDAIETSALAQLLVSLFGFLMP